MDASGKSDPDLPGDWTFVPSEGELMELPDEAAQHGGSRVEDLPLDENASNATREKETMEPKEEKAQHDVAAGGDGEISAGSRDSDIDIIDEDTDHSLESLNSSAIAHSSASLMGFSDISSGTVSSFGNLEAPPTLDASSVASDASLPPGLELQPGVRRYKHVPNTRLNWALTVMAALVAVAATGFGVGHYLGASESEEQSPVQQPELMYSPEQVQVLKKFQEGLMRCLLEQSKNAPPEGHVDLNPAICYQDAEHWKNKFEQLFSENKGLKELLEHSQRNVVMHDHRLDRSDDCAGDLPQDVQKLKLDLILNQMQHLQLMKTFNQVKHSERLSREQARKLERENEQLKARLEEEGGDDLLVQHELEAKVQTLTEENQELQSRLGHESQREAALRSLEHQVQQLQNENERLKRSMQEQGPSPVTTGRISLLRDKVNRLIVENEDLKAVVAKLRYGPPPPAAGEPASDEVKGGDSSPSGGGEADEEEGDAEGQLSELLEVLKKQQADSKQWRRLYEELRKSGREGGTGGGSKSVWRKMLTLGRTLFDDMQAGLDHTLDALVQLASRGSSMATDISPMVQDLGQKVQHELNRRRAELDRHLDGSGDKADSVSQTMRLLESSVKKVFEAGRKFVSKGRETTGRHAGKLVSKLAKVAEMLRSDWEGPAKKTAASESSPEPTSTISPPPSRDESENKWKNGKALKGEVGRDEECRFGEAGCARRSGQDRSGNGEKRHQQQEKGPTDKAKKKRFLDVEEQEEEDWFITRAKDRERQRTEASSGNNENWFLKRRAWRKGANGAAPNRFKPRVERKVGEGLFWDHESSLYDEEEFPE